MNARDFLGWVMVVLLGMISLKGVFWVCSDTALILDSGSWIASEAVIDESWLERSRLGREHSLKVKYHFTVGDITYSGDQFEIPARSSRGSREYVQKQFAPYAHGSIVTIFYDPKDPTRSVVTRPKFDYFFTFFMGGFSLFLCFGSLFLIYLGFRNRFSHRAKFSLRQRGGTA